MTFENLNEKRGNYGAQASEFVTAEEDFDALLASKITVAEEDFDLAFNDISKDDDKEISAFHQIEVDDDLKEGGQVNYVKFVGERYSICFLHKTYYSDKDLILFRFCSNICSYLNKMLNENDEEEKDLVYAIHDIQTIIAHYLGRIEYEANPDNLSDVYENLSYKYFYSPNNHKSDDNKLIFDDFQDIINKIEIIALITLNMIRILTLSYNDDKYLESAVYWLKGLTTKLFSQYFYKSDNPFQALPMIDVIAGVTTGELVDSNFKLAKDNILYSQKLEELYLKNESNCSEPLPG